MNTSLVASFYEGEVVLSGVFTLVNMRILEESIHSICYKHSSCCVMILAPILFQ
jgi:hypothetical protein